jgi:natural product precursor
MKKLKKLQLNRETLRNLSLDNLATVYGGADSASCATCTCACSLACSYGCGATDISCVFGDCVAN